MRSINNHIPHVRLNTQSKDADDGSNKRFTSSHKSQFGQSGNKANSFRSLLGQSDNQSNASTLSNDSSASSQVGRPFQDSSNENQSTDKFSQLFKVLEQLMELIQKFLSKQNNNTPENNKPVEAAPPAPTENNQPVENQPIETDPEPTTENNQPNNPSTLDLSSSQKENFLKIFNAEQGAGVRVLDEDGNGEVSAGDTAILSTGDASSVSQEFRTLSDKDVAAVNSTGVGPIEKSTPPVTEKTPPQNNQRLELTTDQKQAIYERFDIEPSFGSAIILDSNNDNQLSVGDTLEYFQGDDPLPGALPTTHILTTEDIAALNGEVNTNSEAQKSLDENRKKWDNTEDYSYTLQRSCECLDDATRPVDISVKNGELDSAKFSNPNAPSSQPPEYNQLTADDLFNKIQEAIDNGTEVDITYDKISGMPTRIRIDPEAIDRDGGEDITVSNLQIDKPTEHSSPAVSGGGVVVGGSDFGGEAIPNNRIVDINGQNYSVGFLKDQVQNYADSPDSFYNQPDGRSYLAVVGDYDWGVAPTSAAGSFFESYISTTFPDGEPNQAEPTQPNPT